MLENTSQKNLTDDWLNNIGLILLRLEECETRMYNGCADLRELIEERSLGKDFELIKYKNAGLMITYFKNLITNIQPIISEQEYIKFKKEIEELYKLYSNKLILNKEKVSLYENRYSAINKTHDFYLTSYFQVLCNNLTSLRSRIVLSLKKILYLPGNTFGVH